MYVTSLVPTYLVGDSMHQPVTQRMLSNYACFDFLESDSKGCALSLGSRDQTQRQPGLPNLLLGSQPL